MSHLNDRLIRDHHHLSRILDCLDAELTAYDEGSARAPSLSIILDALDYIRTYPEACHHPMEDRVFAHIKPRIKDQELLTTIERVESQHSRLEFLTKQLQADFNSIANDQIVPMTKVVDDYRQYIDLQREHLACENKHILPCIASYLCDEEQNQIELELKKHHDPVFDELLTEQYEELYGYIMESEQAAVMMG